MIAYHVHKKLIENASAYFESAFNSGFMEAATQEITLVDEEDVYGFPIFMKWLYSGNFEPLAVEDDGKDDDSSVVDEPLMVLCKVFVFAEKRLIAALQRLTINVLIQQLGNSWEMPSFSTIQYGYENTLPNSMLRQVFSKFFGGCSGRRTFSKVTNEQRDEMAVIPDFIFDSMWVFADRIDGKNRIKKEGWKALSYRDFLSEG